MVTFSTLETSSELLTFIASGLADILLLGVLFGLLEELLEFPGDHGNLLFIEVRAILFQGL